MSTSEEEVGQMVFGHHNRYGGELLTEVEFTTAPSNGRNRPCAAERIAPHAGQDVETASTTRPLTMPRIQRDGVPAPLRIVLGDREVIVADPAMMGIHHLLERLGRSDLAVLIHGETGVGKEHAAFAVHHHSTRCAGPFVAINCAALQDSLVESELFGHERGAFSGAVTAKPGLLETAQGGTVFLDEVGELPAAIQAKLLRATESRRVLRVGGIREIEVDFRLVAATNRDLDAEVAAGRFRRDLLYRLAVATVEIPPLRERPRESELLARAFLDEGCRQVGRAPLALSEAAVRQLAAHDWPGNVRELRNAMLLAAATAAGDVVETVEFRRTRADARAASIHRADAPSSPHAAPAGPAVRPANVGARPNAAPLTIAEEVAQLEARRMAEALAACDGVHNRAAALIGMPLRTFTTKVKLYGLSTQRLPKKAL
jgi:transcriptional regulator with GAF, ATPase, and Fis domain